MVKLAASAPSGGTQTGEAALTAFLLDALPLSRLTRIADVGANGINEAPYAALLSMGGCEVIGFEPNEEALAQLKANASAHEIYYPNAVGDGEDCTFRLYRSSGFSSVHPPYTPTGKLMQRERWGAVAREIPMQTMRLDDFEDLGPVDLLKIDIQGGEVAVFQGAQTVLGEALAVITELRYLRLYEGEPMLGGVDSALMDMGFGLHKFLFNKARPIPNSQAHRLRKRRANDQLIDGDGVYLRDITRLDTYSDEALMHQCVLAGAVYHSHSLALALLDRLVERGCVPESTPEAYADRLPDDVRAD